MMHGGMLHVLQIFVVFTTVFIHCAPRIIENIYSRFSIDCYASSNNHRSIQHDLDDGIGKDNVILHVFLRLSGCPVYKPFISKIGTARQLTRFLDLTSFDNPTNPFIIQQLNYMETQLTEQENTRALEMLTHIEANPDISQVTLADELGVAVGTINWYLKRLISKGYVKVKRAQRKKLRYIITPEGIALRANLTVDYIKTSFDLYRRVRERSTRCIEQLKSAGFSEVNILGEGEIAEVISLTCLENGVSLSLSKNAPKISIDGLKLALILPEGVLDPTLSHPTQFGGEHG